MDDEAFHLLSRHLLCQDGQPEILAMIFLDRLSRILDTMTVEGAADSLHLPLADILRRARDLHAWQLLMIHTHPSGNPRPSPHDLALTRRLCVKLRLQGQRMTDHIIMTKSHYFSFRANGLL